MGERASGARLGEFSGGELGKSTDDRRLTGRCRWDAGMDRGWVRLGAMVAEIPKVPGSPSATLHRRPKSGRAVSGTGRAECNGKGPPLGECRVCRVRGQSPRHRASPASGRSAMESTRPAPICP